MKKWTLIMRKYQNNNNNINTVLYLQYAEKVPSPSQEMHKGYTPGILVEDNDALNVFLYDEISEEYEYNLDDMVVFVYQEPEKNTSRRIWQMPLKDFLTADKDSLCRDDVSEASDWLMKIQTYITEENIAAHNEIVCNDLPF